jgi:hypothetical protein
MMGSSQLCLHIGKVRAAASFAEILGMCRQLGLKYALLGDGGAARFWIVTAKNKIRLGGHAASLPPSSNFKEENSDCCQKCRPAVQRQSGKPWAFWGSTYRGRRRWEVSETKNLSARKFPALTQGLPREELTGYTSPSALYRLERLVPSTDEPQNDAGDGATVTPGKSSLPSSITNSVYFPDKVYLTSRTTN